MKDYPKLEWSGKLERGGREEKITSCFQMKIGKNISKKTPMYNTEIIFWKQYLLR